MNATTPAYRAWLPFYIGGGFAAAAVCTWLLYKCMHMANRCLFGRIVKANRRRRKDKAHLRAMSDEWAHPFSCAGLSRPRLNAYARGISTVFLMLATSAVIMHYEFYILITFKYAGTVLLLVWGNANWGNRGPGNFVGNWLKSFIVDYWDYADIDDGVIFRGEMYRIVGVGIFGVWLMDEMFSQKAARKSPSWAARAATKGDDYASIVQSTEYKHAMKYISFIELCDTQLSTLLYS